MKLLLNFYTFMLETFGLWFVVMILTFLYGATEIGRGYMIATMVCCCGFSISVEKLKEDT